MGSTLVGMFDDRASAEQARTKLLAEGFTADAVTTTGGDAMTSPATTGATRSSAANADAKDDGPIARFFKGLFGDDDSDDADRVGYRDTYNEAFRRGAYAVSVSTADADDADRAERILNDAGAVDIDERAESWRQTGWSGTAPQTAMSAEATGAETGATRKLQEVEEELQVGKRAVSRGGVRVFTRIEEVPVQESVRLREEHATIERRAVDRPATEADFKEGTIEVREMAEEAVVSKTARVTGEVEIGKTATEREEVVHDTVRKSKVDVEQIDSGASQGTDAVRTGTTSRTNPSRS